MDSIAYESSIGSGNIECGNVTNSNNKIGNINVSVKNVITDENAEMMQWLSPLDARGRHQDVRINRVGGVGNWLLEKNEFRKWRGGVGGADETLLFCYGNPGVGKTYLSSLVIDELCDEPGEEDIAIAMFYCDFRDQQQQTSTNVVGDILKQLAVRGEVLGHVQTAFQKAKKEVGGRGLVLPDMVRLLKQVIAKLPRVFICIDALDECLPRYILELLESLKVALRESPSARLFLTGRPHVEAEVKRFFTTGIMIPISPKARDIKRYLERKLDMDTEPDAMSTSLRADILTIFPKRISEIFLLVSLSVDAILAGVTVSEREQKLNEVSKGNHVEDAYAATLARIRAQQGSRPRLGMQALMWVSNSARPLYASELCYALGVEVGSAGLDIKNVPTIRTLLACSLGLITVEPSSNTVRVVHLTLQEYLSNNPSLFPNPHSIIAEVCLTYLSFQSVRELSPTLSAAPLTFPFVKYASWYWGKHIRQNEMESIGPLALGLLLRFEVHISSQLLLLRYNQERDWGEPTFNTRDGPKGFTGLHGAAFLGIGEILAALLARKEWDVNATDGLGRTALAWAAVGGHEDMVKILLQREDVDPSAADTAYGGTPLWLAAEHGHEGVAKLLLEREDINPNTVDTRYGQTPLCRAAGGGHEGVVRLLLERKGINPNATDTRHHRTPLCCAAGSGHEGVVRLLFEREGINPGTAETEHGPALLWAARGGHEEVVKLILEQDNINPDTADTECGKTPLWWAAVGGHAGVAKLLLEREDIDPNTEDTRYGQTPLCCAAEGGHEEVVRLLLERGDINPNTADTEYGRTPLWLAVVGGHKGVVKLLLDRADINLNTADARHGLTPLHCAREGGHEEVVRLLLERKGCNPQSTDNEYGRSPPLFAGRRHGIDAKHVGNYGARHAPPPLYPHRLSHIRRPVAHPLIVRSSTDSLLVD